MRTIARAAFLGVLLTSCAALPGRKAQEVSGFTQVNSGSAVSQSVVGSAPHSPSLASASFERSSSALSLKVFRDEFLGLQVHYPIDWQVHEDLVQEDGSPVQRIFFGYRIPNYTPEMGVAIDSGPTVEDAIVIDVVMDEGRAIRIAKGYEQTISLNGKRRHRAAPIVIDGVPAMLYSVKIDEKNKDWDNYDIFFIYRNYGISVSGAREFPDGFTFEEFYKGIRFASWSGVQDRASQSSP